ncbi:flavin reductase [Micromonospora radicis]|uniref:Flavin reductase n=1 Tax=Micromonospora radicis TaxID=1894971 RepID=A0A418MZQ5_9ACTN|nr:flavin reductase [Micromonospora radicis]RIV40815.1 flavin reductase [Micromonospora radicis]
MPRLTPHEAMRPLWRCRNCGAEWPCQPAKLSLLVEYRGDRTALLIYLASLLEDARAQLAQLSPEQDLRERFLSWASARSTAEGAG